jgi:hypothetical protein
MNNSKYFQNANKTAQGFYSNFGGNYSNVVPSYSSADGAMGAGQAVAEPFNFIIENSSSIAQTVTLLGASVNNAGNNFGNDAAITITMDNGAITYTRFLGSLSSQPFSFNQLYIESQNSTQVTKTITATWFDLSGTELRVPFFPKKDPMQQQNGILIFRAQRDVPVDVNVSLSFTLVASATVNLSIYPKFIVDTARPLAGRPVEMGYSLPNLSQNQARLA